MKKLVIMVLSLFYLGILQAQEAEQYFHLNLGGGLNNLLFNLQNGTEKGKFGYSINAAYSYFFSSQWGLQTGVGIQYFNTLTTLNLLTSTPNIDTDGDAYEFRTNYKNWKEKQHAFYLEVPLVAQYRYNFGDKFGFIASLGAKVLIPIQTSYETAGGEITTTGYYSQWNVELSDMPQHGFSTITNNYKGNLSLKPAYMLIIDMGGLYKLSEKVDLYLGEYFNYGLNNVMTPNTKLIYQQDGTYNSVLTSNQTNNLKLFSAGIKIGLYFRLGKKKHEAEDVQTAEILQLKRVSQRIDLININPTKETFSFAKPDRN